MANTTIQLKRSSVAGKQPNTSTLAIGELALNITDRILYSSDGSNIFQAAANVTNFNVSANATVSNRITANAIATTYVIANGSIGSNGRVLTSNGAGVYWAVPTGGSGGGFDPDAQYIFTNTTTMSNTLVITKLSANGTLGGLNQVLTSDGAYTFWKDVPGSFPLGDYGNFSGSSVDAFGATYGFLTWDSQSNGAMIVVDLNYPVAATM
jgi:hypothetical protein